MDEEVKGKGYLVSDIYTTARWAFGSWGSPVIAEIHREMERNNHELLEKPANFRNGWEAGSHENRELMKHPMTGNWRDDSFAKNPAAMKLRPWAAAFTGGAMSVAQKYERLQREEPWLFEPGRFPFEGY